MDNRPALVVIGAGGHAKVVADVVEKEGRFRISHLVDDDVSLHGKAVFGYDVRGGIGSLLADATAERPSLLVAIGNNAVRLRVAERLQGKGFQFGRAVHPHAQLGRGAAVGAGSVVMAGTVINPDAFVGANVIVNTGATVDHDCHIDDGAHIAPGAHLCGGVRIGQGTFIGAGAVLIQGIHVGANATIGAGSVVIRDVPDGERQAGAPASRL